MLWGNWAGVKPTDRFLEGNRVVYGHEIKSIFEIEAAIKNQMNEIPLDNGCYQGMRWNHELFGIGSLCALDMDTMELIIQKCIG